MNDIEKQPFMESRAILYSLAKDLEGLHDTLSGMTSHELSVLREAARSLSREISVEVTSRSFNSSKS